MSENEIYGISMSYLAKKNIIPHLVLVGADDRIEKYRHPIPSEKIMKKRVMIVFCARRGGLIASLTRFVNFGKVDPDIIRRHEAVCQVDTSFLHNTKPGISFKDIFSSAKAVYKAVGFPEEWENHHQGGNTGYRARYTFAGPNVNKIIKKNMVFAWNPSIAGVKSEDTVLCGDDDILVLTEIKGWPLIPVEVGKKTYMRPDILVR